MKYKMYHPIKKSLNLKPQMQNLTTNKWANQKEATNNFESQGTNPRCEAQLVKASHTGNTLRGDEEKEVIINPNGFFHNTRPSFDMFQELSDKALEKITSIQAIVPAHLMKGNINGPNFQNKLMRSNRSESTDRL